MSKYLAKFLILTIILTAALSVNYLFAAWTGPTQAPPGGNTPTPIHTGSTPQVKEGGLSVTALSVFGDGWLQGDLNIVGKIKVGNSGANPQAGEIRWTGVDLEVYDGSAWVSLTSEEAAPAADPNYTDCINVGGSWVDAQGVCYFPNTSCPAGWHSKESYSSSIGINIQTRSTRCQVAKRCSSGQHFRLNRGIERCGWRDKGPGRGGSCFSAFRSAIQTEIGCEKN